MTKRLGSASTLNVDALVQRNEERLKALGDAEIKKQLGDKQIKVNESNIILQFLQKEERFNAKTK